MKQEKVTVISNKQLNSNTFEMKLKGIKANLIPGQFVELKLDGKFLRRPFGVADFSDGELTILYKVVGLGTKQMTSSKEGDGFDILTELGNGFDMTKTSKPILIGGGIGIAPLYMLAKAFYNKGIKPEVILGFRNAAEAFYIKEFEMIADVTIATDDGSLGVKGNALDVLKTKDFDYYYACGPMVMLNAIKNYSDKGELSLEARMGCGFGACMGCSIKTVNGYKRVCKEGPVFSAKEIVNEN